MKTNKEKFNLLAKTTECLYIFIGFVFICLILWDRLIRMRLPRSVPFNLTELTFILICFTCTILLIILIMMMLGIMPKSNNITMLPLKSILKFINYFLDVILSQGDGANNNRKIIIKWLFENKQILSYTFIFMKVLRLVMTLLFAYEVFILHQIKIFYIFFPFLLLPLLFNYFIFFLSDLYEKQCDFIDERVEIHHSIKRPEDCIDYMDYVENYYKTINAREWIQQMAWITLKLIDKNYQTTLSISKSFCFEMSKEIKENIFLRQKYYHNEIQKARHISADNIRIYCILYYFNEIKNTFYTILNITIILLYFVTWVYILIKSVHTLKDMPMTLKILDILIPYLSNINPFINP